MNVGVTTAPAVFEVRCAPFTMIQFFRDSYFGHDFFSRNTVNRMTPFASASMVLTDGLLMNYQYVNNAYQICALNWRSSKGFFWDGRGKWYRENQDAELNSNLR